MENTTPPLSLPTILLGLTAVANFLASIVTGFLTWLLTRRKQTADIQQSSALTRKTDAESLQIGSAILFRAFTQLEKFEDLTHKMHLEEIQNKLQIGELEWDGKQKDLAIGILEEQLRQAHAELLILRQPRTLLPGDKPQMT